MPKQTKPQPAKKPKGSNGRRMSRTQGRPPRQPQPKGQSVITAPSAVGGVNKTYFNVGSPVTKGSCCRVKGKDYLGLISITTSNTTGKTVFNQPMSPSGIAMVGTRLSLFGKMFEKFKFRKLKFHLTTQTPTTVQGSYIMAYDHDAADATPPQSDDGIRALMAFQDSVSAPAWVSSELDCHLNDDPQPFYYTNYVDQEERIAFQGQLYLTVLTGYSASAFMSLWIEYEIDFYEPQLDLSAGSEALFTTSTQSVPTGTRQAWNNILTSPSALSPVINAIVDASGNQGLQYLKQGVYLLEQMYGGSTGAGAFATTPTAVPNYAGETVTIVNTDNLHSTSSSLNAAYRKDLVTIPEHGAVLFGNVSATDSWTTADVRSFFAPSKSFL